MDGANSEILYEMRKLMGKHAEDKQGCSHREEANGLDSSSRDMDEYRRAVEKVNLPSFNGDNRYWEDQGKKLIFYVLIISEEVKIKLAKLSIWRVLLSIGLTY